MSGLVETLTSYIPALVACRFAVDHTPITQPAVDQFSAAVLFADISGFTTLTEQLARRGPGGIEELSQLLNDYFGHLTEIIFAHGGDVVKFAGDAMLAIWPVQASQPGERAISNASATSLDEATRRAAGCALAVQEALHNYPLTGGKTLRMRVAVGAGDLMAVYIGGVYQRWEFLLAGDPLVQVGQVEGQIQPGGVILSSQAWERVDRYCRGEMLPSGAVALQKIEASLVPQPNRQACLPDEAEAALWAYVPGAIRVRLAAGHSGWLAELRCLTVLFVNLPDLCYSTPLDEAQHIMHAMQTCLYRYEGSINKISIDEKGSTLVAALGLPPLAHEDDAARGLRAARDIQAALSDLHVHNAIGVATGPVFCGSIGSVQRREYAILGQTVNLSARLMQAALHHPASRLLCDTATYTAAQGQFNFNTLPAISVKGKPEPVPIFQPLEEKRTARARVTELVGRTEERMRLAAHCQALLSGRSGLVIIEGEAGIGKTRLAEDLMRQADSLGLDVLAGAGDAVERLSPYHAWRMVFARLFELDLFNDPPEQQSLRVQAWIKTNHPDLLELTPLLDAVLPLDLPDNELTIQLSGEGRANRTHELLLSLLRDRAQAQRLVLVLEDAHWLDSASWALAKLVWQEVQPVQFVLVTRPMADPPPAEYTWLSSQADTDHLSLEALPFRDVDTLLCRRLGVAHLPEPVLRLVETKAEGHPFFSEELAYALRDNGLIQVVDGECRLAPEAGDLTSLDFPNTIQGVIISRIDRLTPQQQLTIKVASVIGRIFAFRVLRDVYPLEADRPGLQEYLHTLEKLDLTPLETPEPDLAYIFKHIITQEVTYNLMTFVQRQKLHRVVAEWYEWNYTDNLAPYYPLLAYHWIQVVAGQGEGRELLDDPEVVARAVDVIEKAGEQARQNNANQEAINFFGILHDWLPKRGMIEVTALRQAHWERLTGEAYFALGDLQESRQHLEQTVALLNRPVPKTTRGLILRILEQALLQTGHLIHEPAPEKQARRRIELQEAADAYARLSQVYFMVGDTNRLLTAGFQSLNLGEQVGPEAKLSYLYPPGVAAAVIPIHPLARHYMHQGLEGTHQSKDLFAVGMALMCAGIYALGLGQAASAQEYCERSTNCMQRLGDRRLYDQGNGLWAWACYMGGKLPQAFDLWLQVTQSARRAQDPQVLIWCLAGQIETGLPTGSIQLEQARRLAEELQEILKRGVSFAEQIRAWGVSSKVYLLGGELERAGQAAQKALSLMMHNRPFAIYTYESYAYTAETCLALWENELAATPGQATLVTLRSQARQAIKAMWKFAGVFPLACARAWLLQGRYDWLDGREKRAMSRWHKSLAVARRSSLPYEEGLAHLEIGWHLPPGDADRRQHLEQAIAIFEQIGAVRDKALAEKTMM